MSNILILKLGATGDVVRTTPLLGSLRGQVTWVTAAKNVVLLEGLRSNIKVVSWEERHLVPDFRFDLVINLEDTAEVALFLKEFEYDRIFGAYASDDGSLRYTDDSAAWFDLSLISRFGKTEADRLKLANRETYQKLIFDGLGLCFQADRYLLPPGTATSLTGDVAISPEAGPVWPMKNWAYYAELKNELENRGYTVNVLPKRPSLLEHLADVQQHRCLVSGDSLPMHFALGTGTRCVSLFTCTSPWEIYDYGLQTKLVSPLLAEFFFKRGFDPRATSTISVEDVLAAVLKQLEAGTKRAEDAKQSKNNGILEKETTRTPKDRTNR